MGGHLPARARVRVRCLRPHPRWLRPARARLGHATCRSAPAGPRARAGIDAAREDGVRRVLPRGAIRRLPRRHLARARPRPTRRLRPPSTRCRRRQRRARPQAVVATARARAAERACMHPTAVEKASVVGRAPRPPCVRARRPPSPSTRTRTPTRETPLPSLLRSPLPRYVACYQLSAALLPWWFLALWVLNGYSLGAISAAEVSAISPWELPIDDVRQAAARRNSSSAPDGTRLETLATISADLAVDLRSARSSSAEERLAKIEMVAHCPPNDRICVPPSPSSSRAHPHAHPRPTGPRATS